MTSNNQVIAERTLRMVETASNLGGTIIIRIMLPTPSDIEDNASCKVQIEGYIDISKNIVGIDAIHAIKLAIGFVESYIANLHPEYQFFWMEGEQFDV